MSTQASAQSSITKARWFPAVLGIGSFVGVIALIELLIRVGVINRFIVPMPSEIIWAFPRVILEEDVLVSPGVVMTSHQHWLASAGRLIRGQLVQFDSILVHRGPSLSIWVRQ